MLAATLPQPRRSSPLLPSEPSPVYHSALASFPPTKLPRLAMLNTSLGQVDGPRNRSVILNCTITTSSSASSLRILFNFPSSKICWAELLSLLLYICIYTSTLHLRGSSLNIGGGFWKVLSQLGKIKDQGEPVLLHIEFDINLPVFEYRKFGGVKKLGEAGEGVESFLRLCECLGYRAFESSVL